MDDLDYLQDDEDIYTPTEYVWDNIRLLRSRGKDITISAMSEEDIFKLYIHGKVHGCWTAIGLASILAHYQKKDYNVKFLTRHGLPARL